MARQTARRTSTKTRSRVEPRPAGDSVVVARGATKRYGNAVALEGLDLEVQPGRILGFIGPSGSGKTTAVRLLTGIEEPTAGEVRVFGEPPSSFAPWQRARMGYMPQLNVLYPHLSLQENLNFVASLYGVPLRRRARLRRALEFVELTRDRRKLLREASGGMQRRLALAATLLHEPELLFLDEPTAGIDPLLRGKFWDYFRQLKRRGRTLFVTTQYVGEAAYCDEVAVLADGRLLMVDTPEGLRQRAYGGDVVDLLSADGMAESVVQRLHDLPSVVRAERTRTDGRGLQVLVRDAAVAIPRLHEWFEDEGVRLESLEQHVPPFDDVFVKLMHGRRSGV